MYLKQLQTDLLVYAEPDKIEEKFKYFHKTDIGGYAENDLFLGITVPNIRKVIKNCYNIIDLNEVEELLHSKYHEYRLTALLILTLKMKKSTKEEKQKIVKLYLKNTKYINGWDLVDLSAQYILGSYLLEYIDEKEVLYKLANSNNLWEQRISIVATWIFIKNGKYEDTLEIAKILLNNEHDLIHKAVGWMLREVGKRNFDIEYEFLKKYYKQMPRTMLRYSIEKFEEEIRQNFLQGKIRRDMYEI